MTFACEYLRAEFIFCIGCRCAYDSAQLHCDAFAVSAAVMEGRSSCTVDTKGVPDRLNVDRLSWVAIT